MTAVQCPFFVVPRGESFLFLYRCLNSVSLLLVTRVCVCVSVFDISANNMTYTKYGIYFFVHCVTGFVDLLRCIIIGKTVLASMKNALQRLLLHFTRLNDFTTMMFVVDYGP